MTTLEGVEGAAAAVATACAVEAGRAAPLSRLAGTTSEPVKVQGESTSEAHTIRSS